jgi:hypothetical protein
MNTSAMQNLSDNNSIIGEPWYGNQSGDTTDLMINPEDSLGCMKR